MCTSLTFRVPVWLDKIFVLPILLYRRLKFGYTFRKIYLGENRFTLVDQRDFYWLNFYQWNAKQHDSSIYAVRIVVNSPQRIKIVSLHKEIMNPPKGLLVDHRNNYGLDNRNSNLRHATHSQNMCNRRKRRSKTSSRFIGVCFDKNNKRWLAHIGVDGKNIFLGRFDNEIDAAKARDVASKLHFKDFASLNFPG